MVGAAGASIIGFAFQQLACAWRSKLDDQLDLSPLSASTRRAAIYASRIGIAARAVVFLAAGGFLITEAIRIMAGHAATRAKYMRETRVNERQAGSLLKMIIICVIKGASVMNASSPRPLQLVSRVLASLLGGYAFVWGFTSLGITLGVAGGAAYGSAQTLMYLLAFLVFLGCLCWAIAHASLIRVWSILLGGGGLMTGAAWLIARGLH